MTIDTGFVGFAGDLPNSNGATSGYEKKIEAKTSARGKRLGRPSRATESERSTFETLIEADTREMREEMKSVNKEMRRRRKNRKRAEGRRAELERLRPSDRLCPFCKRPKLNDRQWVVLDLPGYEKIAGCVGCCRKITRALVRTT
jgi:hypothetical protein